MARRSWSRVTRRPACEARHARAIAGWRSSGTVWPRRHSSPVAGSSSKSKNLSGVIPIGWTSRPTARFTCVTRRVTAARVYDESVAKRRRAPHESGRIFLLSPANCSGLRARMALSERAQFDLARRLRGPQGVAIGEGFAFVSGLYFKGKLAYALAFARPPDPGAEITGSGALVITPNAGLRPVETAGTPAAR